jgi:hypothetical protein
MAGLTLTGSPAASAAEGCTPLDEATKVFSATTPDGLATISLTYRPHDACADGYEEGPVGSELWVDRQYPYQGFLEYEKVDPGYYIAWTNTYKDDGKQMRACGTSGKGHAIVCTQWY